MKATLDKRPAQAADIDYELDGYESDLADLDAPGIEDGWERTLQTYGTPGNVDEVVEMIKTDLQLSAAYEKQNAARLARECVRHAYDLSCAHGALLSRRHGDLLERVKRAVIRLRVDRREN